MSEQTPKSNLSYFERIKGSDQLQKSNIEKRSDKLPTIISINTQPPKQNIEGGKPKLWDIKGHLKYIDTAAGLAKKEQETRINSLTIILNIIVGTNDELLTDELGKILLKVRLNKDSNYTLNKDLSPEHTKLLVDLSENIASSDPETDKLLVAALDKLGWENPSNDPYNIARYIGLNGSKSMFIAQQDEHKVNPNELAQIISYWGKKDESAIVEQKNIFKNAAKKLQEENVGNATKQDYIGKKINRLYALLQDSEGNILCFNKEGIYEVHKFDELSLEDTSKIEKAPEIKKQEPETVVEKSSDLPDSVSSELPIVVLNDVSESSATLEKVADNKIIHNIHNLIKEFKLEEDSFTNNAQLTIKVIELINKEIKESGQTLDEYIQSNPILIKELSGDRIDYFKDLIGSGSDKYENYDKYALAKYGSDIRKAFEPENKLRLEKIQEAYKAKFESIFKQLNLKLSEEILNAAVNNLENSSEEAAEAFIYKTLADQIVAQYEGFKAKKESDYKENFAKQIEADLRKDTLKKIKDEKSKKIEEAKKNYNTTEEKLLKIPKFVEKLEEIEINCYHEENELLKNITIPDYEAYEEIDFEDYIEKLGITNNSILEVLQPLIVGGKEGDTGVIGYEDIYIAELTKQLQQAYPLEKKKSERKEAVSVDKVDSLEDILSNISEELESDTEIDDGVVTASKTEIVESPLHQSLDPFSNAKDASADGKDIVIENNSEELEMLDYILTSIGYNLKVTDRSKFLNNSDILYTSKLEDKIISLIADNILYRNSQRDRDLLPTLFSDQRVLNNLLPILNNYNATIGSGGTKKQLVSMLSQILEESKKR